LDTQKFDLLHKSFVHIQAAKAGLEMLAAIQSFPSGVIGNAQFIVVIVDLISSVFITHPPCA
jgi:hypothetical protein